MSSGLTLTSGCISPEKYHYANRFQTDGTMEHVRFQCPISMSHFNVPFQRTISMYQFNVPFQRTILMNHFNVP